MKSEADRKKRPSWNERTDELRALMQGMRMTNTKLADVLGTTPETIAKWRNGVYPVPKYALAYLRLAAVEEVRKRLLGCEEQSERERMAEALVARVVGHWQGLPTNWSSSVPHRAWFDSITGSAKVDVVDVPF